MLIFYKQKANILIVAAPKTKSKVWDMCKYYLFLHRWEFLRFQVKVINRCG
ncbi:hypothetical protein SAMN05660206_101134 [Sphingobacterium wenxiniae]|uniref:Uncharacterized protein n=1 Tax=Sphingobacterium wenxiniae TaxID=683125 RepID=A0A1I6NVW3_9SPHI|nr:hypothetical protein SAMN05660206_101134 [Sphingobacterium wenxiniae]